jgi:hypothetical protein
MKRTRTKILLAITLATIVWVLLGCGGEPPPSASVIIVEKPPVEHVVQSPQSANGQTDLSYLIRLYETYNEGYFQNKLPKNTVIDIAEEKNMASAFCKNDNVTCIIQFNLKYTLAPRTADEAMLHEMCHVKSWGKDLDSLGVQIEHGLTWRACMLQLDMQGAFREIIIDKYQEGF